MHEHLLLDIRCWFLKPQSEDDRARAYAPLTRLSNLGWVRYNWFAHWDNLALESIPNAISELRRFYRAGGRTLVDVTPIDIGRDPAALVKISEASGVNIVMGTGYYLKETYPRVVVQASEQDIARRLIRDLTRGVGRSGIRAGIIGEIGSGWPIEPFEEKMLRASAIAQRETGAPLTLHPGRNQQAPEAILSILADAGADLSRVVMGHMDARIVERKYVNAIGANGCFMEWDTFGNETSYFPLSSIDMPSDGQRMDMIEHAISSGFARQIVLSHDVCSKHRLTRYGGHGFAHILENIVPRLRSRGVKQQIIDAMLIDGPANLLAVA
jgi:phosphotriesterase-related protein